MGLAVNGHSQMRMISWKFYGSTWQIFVTSYITFWSTIFQLLYPQTNQPLFFGSREPLRGFPDFWSYWSCALVRTYTASALGGFGRPPRKVTVKATYRQTHIHTDGWRYLKQYLLRRFGGAYIYHEAQLVQGKRATRNVSWKSPIRTYPTSIWRPCWEWSGWNFAEIFGTGKLESMGYHNVVCVILGLAVFVQLRLVTDGRTHDDSIYCASVASRRKNHKAQIIKCKIAAHLAYITREWYAFSPLPINMTS